MKAEVQVKERPILFSTPMVVAVLGDLKDITRRVKGLEFINQEPDRYKLHGHKNFEGQAFFEDLRPEITPWISPIPCPYGNEGDVLWVRETFYAYGYWSLLDGKWKFNDSTMQYEGYRYMDNPPHEINVHRNDGIGWYKRPSIFMPREAVRIKVLIKSIRVERLHDITEEDTKREGAPMYVPGHGLLTQDELNSDPGYANFINYRMGFEYLWSEINGKESWEANPWVWRIEFEKL
jgi:hypothetical protein